MAIVANPSVADALAALPERDAAAVRAALREIPAAFGRPHVHAGLGIRQLRPGIYEARVGLQRRAIFAREADTLCVTMVGTHDEVKRYLRGR